jgi:hypothetical protein
MHDSRKSVLALSAALAGQIIATVMWYVTLPHYSRWESTYAHWTAIIFFAFVYGLLDKLANMRKMTTLGVLIAVCTGVIHLVASFVGAPIDFASPIGAVYLVVLTVLPSIGFCITAGFAGRTIRRRFQSLN